MQGVRSLFGRMMIAASADSLYILRNLISADFKVRYRNMSLGIFWSLINPLVMMGVLTFVFTVVFVNDKENFALFVLVGLLPYNFFSLALSSSAVSLVGNAPLVKKVPFRRELVPVSVVFGSVIHYLVQIGLLLVVSAFFVGFSATWAWLPLILLLQITFVCGLALLCSALDVYFRDIQYIVESAVVVLFWLAPIFYGLEEVGQEYAWLYELNPIAAVILLTRSVLLDATNPSLGTLAKLVFVSLFLLFSGLFVFRKIERDFADYL